MSKIFTYPEVWGDLWHLLHQTGSQVLHILQIILHGVGQVHQVVQIDGVVFCSFELQVKNLGLTYDKVTIRCHRAASLNPKEGARVHYEQIPSPDRSVRLSFWGCIWVISSGFSFSAPFLRFVTSLSLRTVWSPRGFSIRVSAQPLLIRDCSSSQRVDTVSPCCRKSWERQQRGKVKGQSIMFSSVTKSWWTTGIFECSFLMS